MLQFSFKYLMLPYVEYQFPDITYPDADMLLACPNGRKKADIVGMLNRSVPNVFSLLFSRT